MKTKISLISTTVATIIITGCSGGGSTAETGTAFYKDSAVEGVEYECGSKKGTTDADGKFEYEVGKDCTLKLAHIKLRDVNSNELKNSITIREDNPKVATFLQSMDIDGNPDNGITITKKQASILKRILEDEDINSVPSGDSLSIVVAKLHNEDDEYNGHEVDEDSAMAHVEREKEKDSKKHKEESKENEERHAEDNENHNEQG